ncbi:hypothetical protein COCVIDRAFT_33999 [Bipolaris victoriae FI3]|uniref:MARVEL domain-containing protein n=1 Tax=Bipolaris victoriae (strain FI3) TaxID=930091 RepID=W7ELQ0_BIPV3|nr:hypothetical protein COCVIDRAFT_33999 [Bipolaris victoriae FI3]
MLRTPPLLFLSAMLVDLILAITLISLFASAYPDRFRTALWRNGGSEGWNSDPQQRVYDYANYRESPPMPLIWDQSSTMFHLVIAVIALFVWIVRFQVNCLSGYVLDLHASIMTNAIYDILLVGLYASSAVLQNSGDFSDPGHIGLRPWYLERGCKDAWERTRGGCEVMRVSYGVTVFAVIWCCLRFMTTCLYLAYILGREHEIQDVLPDYDEFSECKNMGHIS